MIPINLVLIALIPLAIFGAIIYGLTRIKFMRKWWIWLIISIAIPVISLSILAITPSHADSYIAGGFYAIDTGKLGWLIFSILVGFVSLLTAIILGIMTIINRKSKKRRKRKRRK